MPNPFNFDKATIESLFNHHNADKSSAVDDNPKTPNISRFINRCYPKDVKKLPTKHPENGF